MVTSTNCRPAGEFPASSSSVSDRFVSLPGRSAAGTGNSRSDAADAAGTARYRTWTSVDGQYRVVAKLVKLEDKTVHLERKDDGQIVVVPLAKLSPEDRAFARRQAGN